MSACSCKLQQISYQVSFCPQPNRVNTVMPQICFGLYTDTETHLIRLHNPLQNEWVTALRFPVFDNLSSMIHWDALWLMHILQHWKRNIRYDLFKCIRPPTLSRWREHLSSLSLPFPLCWTYPTRVPAGETSVRCRSDSRARPMSYWWLTFMPINSRLIDGVQ